MSKESYQIVTGLVIVMIVLVIAVGFIFLLVSYSNKRKLLFLQEKQTLQLLFNEQLLQAQQEMQEQTFNSISQEIHDNVGQILSLAKVQINILEQKKNLDTFLLNEVKENIGKAMVDLRDIARSLSSDRIKNSPLTELANHELQRINAIGIIQTFLDVEGTEVTISEPTKLIVMRVFQECLQNILKHACATKIEVKFAFTQSHLRLQISDNGVGFDTEVAAQQSGLGLQNIVNRVALLGGQCSVKSVADEGTQITIILPYE